MEDTLRGRVLSLLSREETLVLILVLMEDTLRGYEQEFKRRNTKS